jgi:hypothetical protein
MRGSSRAVFSALAIVYEPTTLAVDHVPLDVDERDTALRSEALGSQFRTWIVPQRDVPTHDFADHLFDLVVESGAVDEMRLLGLARYEGTMRKCLV